MNFKGRTSMLELLNQPYNVIHELYYIIFVKEMARQKAEEEKQKKEEEERKKQEAEKKKERERLANNVPKSFAAAKTMRTPPTKQAQEINDSLSGMTEDDLEDFIEEVSN